MPGIFILQLTSTFRVQTDLFFFEVMILKRTQTCLQHLESTLSIERVKNVKMNYFRWFELKGWSVYKPQTPETGTNKRSSRIYNNITVVIFFFWTNSCPDIVSIRIISNPFLPFIRSAGLPLAMENGKNGDRYNISSFSETVPQQETLSVIFWIDFAFRTIFCRLFRFLRKGAAQR